jgi:hypothetical protein
VWDRGFIVNQRRVYGLFAKVLSFVSMTELRRLSVPFVSHGCKFRLFNTVNRADAHQSAATI